MPRSSDDHYREGEGKDPGGGRGYRDDFAHLARLGIPALKEVTDFDQRYAKAMGEIFGSADSAQQMAMAAAMYPGMKDMIGKMRAQSINMEGAQILTEMVIETVKTQAQMSQEQNQTGESPPARHPFGDSEACWVADSGAKRNRKGMPPNRRTGPRS